MFKKVAIVLGLALTMVVVAAGVMYLMGLRVVLDGGGMPHLRFVERSDAQAVRIERHREEQRAEYAKEIQPSSSEVASPRGGGGAAVSDVHSSPAPAAAPASVEGRRPTLAAPYWTDFRGPRRDGEYSEQPILTTWPTGGLKPLWKQPAGGGYASFTTVFR